MRSVERARWLSGSRHRHLTHWSATLADPEASKESKWEQSMELEGEAV